MSIYKNNNKVYTSLSERCSQSTVFISQCHSESHRQYCAMAHVALRFMATIQIQTSDENTCIQSYPDKVTNITVK